MENKIIKIIAKYVHYLESVYKSQLERFDDIEEYASVVMRAKTYSSNKKYYYQIARKQDKEKNKVRQTWKYLGTESSEEVGLIKEAHYYSASISHIETNLDICQKLLDAFRFTDYDSINESMSNVYQDAVLNGPVIIRNPDVIRWKQEKEAYKEQCGPWYPEDLIVTTADGSLVRSKVEGLIYNHYLHQEITYVYELPIKLAGGIIRHPDFTLLSEVDWRSIILHDHEGRYGYEEDRERYNNDMYLYWQSGYIPGVNIFFTFDDPRGGFDITTIQNIIDTKIRPRL